MNDATWQVKDGKLAKEFRFTDFNAALAFVNKVGGLAEMANHHPDLYLYDYNKLKIMLSTHSADAITERDHKLARQIDQLKP